ncbi:MAG: VanZ family protein [Flavobacteriaceae bacterium]|jgi:VanZ family protein|nr:VanZ family protein [Flavobacteriaceae bacterium]
MSLKSLFFTYLSFLTWLLLKPGVSEFEQKYLDFALFNDKTAHTGTFGLLTVLGIFAFPRMQRYLLVLIFTLYGVIIEYIQREVGRDFDYFDMLADFFGCVLGAFFIWILLRIKY